MLSSRARYATRALLDLSLRYDQGSTLIQDISERQRIPLKYLQQILVSLKSAGFVQSRKGPGGGYFLARHPREISLGAVVRAMDGPLTSMNCNQDCGCTDPGLCALEESFVQARNALTSALDSTTFETLRDRQTTLDNRSAPVDFVI